MVLVLVDHPRLLLDEVKEQLRTTDLDREQEQELRNRLNEFASKLAGRTSGAISSAVCGAEAEKLLAEADARRASDAGGAAAAAVSCVQDGTPYRAAADLHTARHAEPHSKAYISQGLGDPLMVAYVEASKDKTKHLCSFLSLSLMLELLLQN
ncbi:TPA: hypothetical protein ACH3X1_001552 [Trebouxia sp. C0004]